MIPNFAEDIRERYTEGDCWLLATVLVDDYNIGQFVTTEHSSDDPGGDWFHVAVALESGLILDINGLQNLDDFKARWGGYICYPDSIINSTFHYDCNWDDDDTEPNWNLALKIANQIVESIGVVA